MNDNILIHTNYAVNIGTSAADLKKSFKTFKMQRTISDKVAHRNVRFQDSKAKQEVQLQDAEFSKVDNPVLSFVGPATKNVVKRSQTFTEPEYNLWEYGRIIDTEALAMRAFLKKKQLMFRNGYYFASKNKKNIDYIEKRFREIALVQKRPMQVILDEIAYSLISLHNCYFVKVRKESASSGKARTTFDGKKLSPVAAIFVLPAEAMVQKIDDSLNVYLYRQYMPRNKYRNFEVENIEHIFFNRRPGFTMGTPPLEPVKDDILALRRIEECVEKLIYKNLFPIMHVKVGTEKMPAQILRDGTREVDIATEYLSKMEEDGGITTNERVEIKAIGAESLALRVESYLTYFKNRVYAGLGMSGIDFGEGGSTTKQSGEVISSALIDAISDYQTTFASFMNRFIMELLLESGNYENELDVPEKDMVYFQFNPIDKNETITKESHILNLANAGLIMIDEAREAMDYTDKRFDPEKTVPYLLQTAAEDATMENDKELAEHGTKQQKQLISHTAKVMPKPAAGGAAKKPAAKKTAQKAAAQKAKAASKSAAQKANPKNKQKLKDLLMSGETALEQRLSRVVRDCMVDHLTFGIYDSFTEFEVDSEESLASKILDSQLDTAIRLMVESSAFQSEESIELLIDCVLDEELIKLEGENLDEAVAE